MWSVIAVVNSTRFGAPLPPPPPASAYSTPHERNFGRVTNISRFMLRLSVSRAADPSTHVNDVCVYLGIVRKLSLKTNTFIFLRSALAHSASPGTRSTSRRPCGRRRSFRRSREGRAGFGVAAAASAGGAGGQATTLAGRRRVDLQTRENESGFWGV